MQYTSLQRTRLVIVRSQSNSHCNSILIVLNTKRERLRVLSTKNKQSSPNHIKCPVDLLTDLVTPHVMSTKYDYAYNMNQDMFLNEVQQPSLSIHSNLELIPSLHASTPCIMYIQQNTLTCAFSSWYCFSVGKIGRDTIITCMIKC